MSAVALEFSSSCLNLVSFGSREPIRHTPMSITLLGQHLPRHSYPVIIAVVVVQKSKCTHTGTIQTSACVSPANVPLAKLNPVVKSKVNGKRPIMRTKQDPRYTNLLTEKGRREMKIQICHRGSELSKSLYRFFNRPFNRLINLYIYRYLRMYI